MEDAQYAIVSYGGTARTAYEAMLEARKKAIKSAWYALSQFGHLPIKSLQI